MDMGPFNKLSSVKLKGCACKIN